MSGPSHCFQTATITGWHISSRKTGCLTAILPTRWHFCSRWDSSNSASSRPARIDRTSSAIEASITDGTTQYPLSSSLETMAFTSGCGFVLSAIVSDDSMRPRLQPISSSSGRLLASAAGAGDAFKPRSQYPTFSSAVEAVPFGLCPSYTAGSCGREYIKPPQESKPLCVHNSLNAAPSGVKTTIGVAEPVINSKAVCLQIPRCKSTRRPRSE